MQNITCFMDDVKADMSRSLHGTTSAAVLEIKMTRSIFDSRENIH